MSADLESRLLELLFAARDGRDQAARTELNDLLRANPACRSAVARLLVDEQALISRLRDEHMVAMLDAKPRPVPAAKPAVSRRPSNTSWLAVAAVLLFCGFLTWLAVRPKQEAKPNTGPTPVAVMKEELDAVWQDLSPAPGSSLPPGKLKLASGMASIEFASGARLLLEGPAEVELVSDMNVFCRSGKILANVPPPARGFTIATPSSRVVDRGTVFGMQVRESGDALVKVIQGEVELQTHDRTIALKTQAAATVDPQGNTSDARAEDAMFPAEESFHERIAAGRKATVSRWRSATDSLTKDPSALLVYNFREAHPASRSVRNQAPDAPPASHGSLVGAAWSDGRWQGKRALEFTGRGDRLLFALEGKSKSVTLLSWVRVDSLPNLYQILLMPDAYRRAALSWMIDGDGNLRLAITNGKSGPAQSSGWEGPVKAPAISNLDLGRWVFLASTYDSTTGLVCHYRDGERIGTGTFPGNIPVVHGTYTFGNWNSGDRGANGKKTVDQYRNFNGRLDEIAIINRAMTGAELLSIYQAGKP